MKKAVAAAAALSVACLPGAVLAQKLPGIPKGNHYVCYPAKFTDPFEARSAIFTDQFGTWNVKVIGITQLCVPATKKVKGGTFPPTDATAHLTCYKILAAEKNPLPPVVTNDQFGAHLKVALSLPTDVCLPAGKLKMG